MNAAFKQTERLVMLTDVIKAVEAASLPDTRKRDYVSAVNRVAKMGGAWAATFVVTPDSMRKLVGSINPATHQITAKSFANIHSNLRAALALAGVIDAIPHGASRRNPAWAPLAETIAGDLRLAHGLARFINFCASRKIAPADVNNKVALAYLAWMEVRTLVPHPGRDARRIPRLWNSAVAAIGAWPRQRLDELPMGSPRRKVVWDDLPADFHSDAEAYLELRRQPDPFDERPGMPTRPLAAQTLRLNRAHLKCAFDVISKTGPSPTSLADLVTLENYKAVLRHYYDGAAGKSNAFAIGIAKTLMAVAKYHVRLDPEQLSRLRKIASRLPSVPFDLTPKNKALMQCLDNERVLASLLSLPDQLVSDAKSRLPQQKPFDSIAQVGLAIAILLASPMRSQNLIALNWKKHVREPRGPRGPIRLLIPAGETKTRCNDFCYDLDPETSALLRWNRAVLLPAIGADPDGDVFVVAGGRRRSQSALCDFITAAITTTVGVHMTAHQFRHAAAKIYLNAHPEDFETVRQLLGHSFGKTTLIYAGLSSERASRSFTSIVLKKREELRNLAVRKSRHARPRKR